MSDISPANADTSTLVDTRPQETFEIEEANTTTQDDIVYPTGSKLYATLLAILMSMLLIGLDLSILTTAIPAITNQFHTISDIGWYQSAYRLTMCAFLFMFGKVYSVWSVKRVYIASVAIFELGSLLCTIAPSSTALVVGRAVGGVGCSGIIAGSFVILTQSVPLRQRALIGGLMGSAESLASVSAPVLSGVITDSKLTWRGCFGINLPLGIIGIVIIAFSFEDPQVNPDINLPLKEKIRRLDIPSSMIFVPSMICLFLALQWGGITYGWTDARIISMLVLFAGLLTGFGYLQYRRQENALLPPRILKQRSIVAGAWFAACCTSTLAVVEYYIVIYFQAIKGYTATRSGLLLLPQVIGLCISGTVAGAATTWLGYYVPFMLITSILTPIATGLLTTMSVDATIISLLCYEALLGFGIGLGVQAPQVAAQTVLSAKEVSIGIGIVCFGQNLGPALFIAISQAVFQSRLSGELAGFFPGANATTIDNMGLTDITNLVGPDKLHAVLAGYDEAVVQTLYLPVALTCLTLFGSLSMEWRSVKKKQN